MSRADGAAFPPFPSDTDWWSTRHALHRESDELPDVAAYEESATWVITMGDVIQPHCMCGKWSSVGQCEDCQKELALWQRWDAEDAAYRRAFHSEVRPTGRPENAP